MKIKPLIKNFAVAPLAALASFNAYAADSSLATTATGALEQAKSDGESVGAKVIAAVVVIVGLSLIIGLIRKV